MNIERNNGSVFPELMNVVTSQEDQWIPRRKNFFLIYNKINGSEVVELIKEPQGIPESFM